MNSIWHSIRTDSPSENAAGTHRDDLPDAVGLALFEYPSLPKAAGIFCRCCSLIGRMMGPSTTPCRTGTLLVKGDK
jgi:hypothetical protein